MNILVDKTLIEYNDKRAYSALNAMEQTGEYNIYFTEDPFSDPKASTCAVIATNSRKNAESLCSVYPEKMIYLIENPLNKGYKSTLPNLQTVWCWDDFQFFMYFPKKA